MNKKYLNAAVAVLLALGINACSSGGSESVGISQEENRSIQAVNKITEINETLNTQLTEAKKALSYIQSALAEAKAAPSGEAAETVRDKTLTALDALNKALKEAAYYSTGSNSVESYLTNASKASPDAQKNINSALDVISQIRAVFEQASDAQKALNTEVDAVKERERLAKTEAEKIAAHQQKMSNLENSVNVQLSTIEQALENVQTLLAKAEKALTSKEASIYSTEAKTSVDNAKAVLEQANNLIKQADESNEKIANLMNSANDALKLVESASDKITEIASALFAKEENITKDETEKVMKANAQAASAKNNARSQLTIAEAASQVISTSSNQISSETASKNAQANLATLKNEMEKLQAATGAAKKSVTEAKSIANISSTAGVDVKEAKLALQKAEQLLETATNSLTNANSKVEQLVAREKASTTKYSYERADSVVQDYMDSVKRDVLFDSNELKATNAPANCANSLGSTCHKDKARGTVVVNYNSQSYAKYAVLREKIDAEGATPANAFIVLAKESDLTKDKSVIKEDVTYTGKASYSRQNMPAVVTRDFTMTVNNDKVTGSVYQTTQTPKGPKTTEYVALKEGSIAVNNGVVGFSGKADFNGITKGVEGSYNGFFVGQDAKEVIGTFESDATEKAKSIQGAFAGSK